MAPYTFRMTGSGEPPSTENAQQRTFPGADTYTRVPWLVVYTWGPGSEEVAHALSAQCAARGTDIVDVRPVDELTTVQDVDGYAVVVFVVSARSVTSGDTKAKRQVGAVIGRYRSRRLQGLDAVIAGRERYAFAGVIQLVVLADGTSIAPGAALTALMEEACRVHPVQVGDAELPDLFEVFDGEVTLPHAALPVPRPIDHVETLWTEARDWGVETPEDVHGIVSLIDGRRGHYRKKQHTAKGAKHPDHPELGALDLALNFDDIWAECPEGMPEAEYEERKANFIITGGRAVRHTILRVQESYPNFGRPAGRAGTKYNRPAFRAIYGTLRALQRRLDNDNDAAEHTD